MYTRLQLTYMLLNLATGGEYDDNMAKMFVRRFNRMYEHNFIDIFEKDTGLHLTRIIKNRYFIN